MRSKTSTWFETKVRYDKRLDDGQEKKVTEVFTIEAISFTEAEAKITEEISAYTSGETFIKAITRAPYSEVFFFDDNTDNKWYRTKLSFAEIDDKTERKKTSCGIFLMQAKSIDDVYTLVNDIMRGQMVDYTIVSIVETPILEVLEHN